MTKVVLPLTVKMKMTSPHSPAIPYPALYMMDQPRQYCATCRRLKVCQKVEQEGGGGLKRVGSAGKYNNSD